MRQMASRNWAIGRTGRRTVRTRCRVTWRRWCSSCAAGNRTGARAPWCSSSRAAMWRRYRRRLLCTAASQQVLDAVLPSDAIEQHLHWRLRVLPGEDLAVVGEHLRGRHTLRQRLGGAWPRHRGLLPAGGPGAHRALSARQRCSAPPRCVPRIFSRTEWRRRQRRAIAAQVR